MRVKRDGYVQKVLESFVAPGTRNLLTKGMAPQTVKHLDVEQVRRVQALAGASQPVAYGCRRPQPEQPSQRRRSIEDDQGPSAEIARIVCVPQASDRYVRRFIQLDRLAPRQALHKLLKSRLLGHLLYLREQVVR